MSTGIKSVDPFGMPDDFEFPKEHKAVDLSFIDFEIDLHDDYDLLSQPLKQQFSSYSRGSVKNEGG